MAENYVIINKVGNAFARTAGLLMNKNTRNEVGMMGNVKKCIVLLMVAMLLLVPVTAFADDGDAITVQLNGDTMALTDAAPLIVDGRVFVPFRAVFEGLEAQVSYDAEQKQITAVKDEQTVVMTIGDLNIELTKGEGDTAVTTQVAVDAASFVQDGRTYVPVRFAAQAMDCKVGWDSAERVVIVVDPAKIAADAKAEYTMMDKMQAFNKKFNQGNYAIAGTMKMNMTETSSDSKMDFDFQIKGITSADQADMQVAAQLDVAMLKEELIAEQGALDEQSEAMLAAMENMEMDMIMDLKGGKMFISSNLFTALLGAADHTWYSMDLNELLAESGMDMSSLMQLNQVESMSTVMDEMIASIPVSNSVGTAAFIDSIYMMKDAFSDEAFKQQGDNYVSNYLVTENGVATKMTTTLMMRNNQVVGYSMAVSVTDKDDVMTMNMQQEGMNMVMDMAMNMAGMTMNLDADFTYEATTETPRTTPGTDAVIVPLENLFAAVA